MSAVAVRTRNILLHFWRECCAIPSLAPTFRTQTNVTPSRHLESAGQAVSVIACSVTKNENRCVARTRTGFASASVTDMFSILFCLRDAEFDCGEVWSIALLIGLRPIERPAHRHWGGRVTVCPDVLRRTGCRTMRWSRTRLPPGRFSLWIFHGFTPDSERRCLARRSPFCSLTSPF